jgi:hypothetical protein
MQARRHLMRGAFVLLAISGLAGEVSAVDAGVRSACQADYFAYCSSHDPDGPGVRQCMNRNGARLSQGCVDALIAAGEVSRTEVARRAKADKVRR